MNLGLLIIIIVGIVLFVYGNYKAYLFIFKDKKSKFGIYTFYSYIVIVMVAFVFGALKLFEWLFTIKLW